MPNDIPTGLQNNLKPLVAKDREKKLAFKPNENFSRTHHAKRNSMACPTQTVVGKGISNPLIDESLLKILRDLIPTSLPKSPTNFVPWNGRITKSCIRFPSEMITDRTCHVNIIPLTVKLSYPWWIRPHLSLSPTEWQVHLKYCYVQNYTSNSK